MLKGYHLHWWDTTNVQMVLGWKWYTKNVIPLIKSSNSERGSVCSGDIHSHCGADQYTGKKNSNEENYIQVGSNL